MAPSNPAQRPEVSLIVYAQTMLARRFPNGKQYIDRRPGGGWYAIASAYFYYSQANELEGLIDKIDKKICTVRGQDKPWEERRGQK